MYGGTVSVWLQPVNGSAHSFFLRTDLQSFFGLPVRQTAQLSHTSVPNSHSRTHTPGTQLSIPPNRLVTGITRLMFPSKALLCCIVKTPTVTCAWKHKRTDFYTLFIRDATGNWLGIFSCPFLVLKRGEREVADWSTDLNLKGCAVIRRGESGQLCYTRSLSIHRMTAAEECIQSEVLNVDTLKCSVRLMWFVQDISQRIQCPICFQWRCVKM